MKKDEIPPFKKKGSWLAFCLLLMVFWPLAIVYIFCRSWGIEGHLRNQWEKEQGWRTD